MTTFKAQNLLNSLYSLPQALRFILVGGAAAATHLLAVGVLVAAGQVPPLLANGLAFLIAFGVSYCGHAWLSFAEHQARTWASAARFFAVASLSFAVNETLYAIALKECANASVPCSACTGIIFGAKRPSSCWWRWAPSP